MQKGSYTFLDTLRTLRVKFLIRLALDLNKTQIPFKFFIIHRVVKLFLLNSYTANLLLKRG